MPRKLRTPFVIVVAGALAACSRDAPPPEGPLVVLGLPPNPPPPLPPPVAPPLMPDADLDGIPDADDRCPDERESGTDRYPANGCVDHIVIIGTNPPPPPVVRFEGHSAVPSSSSAAELDAAAAVMKEHPEITLVRIEGHDDPSNAPDKALVLSRARAEAVVKALVKRGVDGKRLRAVGVGGYCPIADPRTADGRAKNRRAHFRVELTDSGPTEAEIGCGPSRDAGVK